MKEFFDTSFLLREWRAREPVCSGMHLVVYEILKPGTNDALISNDLAAL